MRFKSENLEINKLVEWVTDEFVSKQGDVNIGNNMLIIGTWRFRESGDKNSLYLEHRHAGQWKIMAEWYL